MRIIAVFSVCVFLAYITPSKYLKQVLLINSCLIAWLGYALNTENQYDLIFHFDMYDYLIGKSIEDVFSYYYTLESPLYVLYVYFLGFFKNKHILPAVTVFIGYYTFSYFLSYCVKKDSLSKKVYMPIYLLILCALPWHDFSAGIRGALAFSICAWAAFFDFVKKEKIKGLAFYIASVFIHQAAIGALLVSLLVHATKKYNKKVKVGIFITILATGLLIRQINTLISFLANSTGLNILQTIANSFASYVVQGKDLYEYRIVIIRALVSIIALFYISTCEFSAENEFLYKKRKEIVYYYTVFVGLTFAFVWQYDVFCRYSVATTLLLPLVLTSYGSAPIVFRLGKIKDRSYGIVMCVVAIFVLVINYGSYYSHWRFGG